jgi:hypothetical protein
MGTGNILNREISQTLHVGTVKVAYQSINKDNDIQQMLKHNDWSTSLDYMEDILSYLPLQSRYNIHSVQACTTPSAAS